MRVGVILIVWVAFIVQINAQELKKKQLVYNDSKEIDNSKTKRKDVFFQAFRIDSLEFNSRGSDIWPRMWGDTLVFASNRNSKKGIGAYFDLYMVDRKTSKPKKMGRKFNSRFNDLSPAFSEDKRSVYFTRNSSKRNFFKRDWSGYSRFKIYKAVKKSNRRTVVKELPFNKGEFSLAHPSLDEKGNQLYFVSNMTGAIGGTDIFVVAINEDGSYGEPRNLGSKVNTSENETSPFISADNILYFASEGHMGYGGLDIFAIDLNDPMAEPINLGMPMNGDMDDFGFAIDTSLEYGYFSSNREGGKGHQDIYAFRQLKPVKELLVQTKKGTLFDSSIDNLLAKNVMKEKNLLQAENRVVSIGTELISHLSLAPVLFEYDRSRIWEDSYESLHEIVTYLKRFPHISIKVLGYTDQLGRKEYNLVLSERRALSAKRFLVDRDIDPSRIGIVGLGSNHLFVRCDSCTWRQLERNRRVVFVVQSLGE